jgi:hypothetical protein
MKRTKAPYVPEIPRMSGYLKTESIQTLIEVRQSQAELTLNPLDEILEEQTCVPPEDWDRDF